MAFSGSGTGTPGDPYQITTYSQLKEMLDDVTASYLLMNDIDASDSREENERAGFPGTYDGWEPVGTAASPFTGNFDGDNFTISNLYINLDPDNFTATDGAGLFGYVNVDNGSIVDTTLENINYTGKLYLGGIAGIISASSGNEYTVSNCHVTGTITSTANGGPSGGIAGTASHTDFSSCRANVTISTVNNTTGTNGIGGFIGDAGLNTSFVSCVSGGSITATETGTGTSAILGGFVGYIGNINPAPSFQSCKSSCIIVSSVVTSGSNGTYIGGFCGYSYVGDYDYCYSTGNVLTTDTYRVSIGGFAGYFKGAFADECCATGDVNATAFTSASEDASCGGFAGFCDGGNIDNCYARGDICKVGVGSSTRYHLGGFFGKSNNGSFTNCYSTGFVQSVSGQTTEGGFCGERTSGTYTTCYWDTETSGQSVGIGGGGSQIDVTGATTANMKLEATYTGFDFDAIWDIPTYMQPDVSQSNLTAWLSRTSQYEDFGAGGTNDNDPFYVVIPSTNEIRWAATLESILLGTAGDEWEIRSNKLQTPISPTNFTVKDQTTWGSANIQPVKVNDVLLFVDYVRRKVREMTYADPRYVAPDLTELAEHITSTGIVDVAYQKNPESILWCVLTDGSLISMVYNREQNVIAWSDHPIDGDVLSICIIPDTNEDSIFIVVKRTINGDDKLYLEKFASRTVSSLAGSFFVDCGITTSVSATDKITGLDHLEGKKVAVLADGDVIYDGTEDESEVSGGEVTLPASATYAVVQVGLPYTALLKPMRIVQESGGQVSLAAITRVNEIKVTFLNSLGVQYGVDEDDLHDVDFTDIRLENADYITGLYSCDVPLTMPGNYSFENPIIIASSKPLPCTVKSIVVGFEKTGR
jgi:hypothetical protein